LLCQGHATFPSSARPCGEKAERKRTEQLRFSIHIIQNAHFFAKEKMSEIGQLFQRLAAVL